METFKEERDELRRLLKTNEHMKHERLTLKYDDSKKGRNHNIKANDKSNNGNWKSKFFKLIKID